MKAPALDLEHYSHPLAVLLAGLVAAFERDLARQDGGRADLPALGDRRQGGGGLARLLQAKAKEPDLHPPKSKAA